MLRDYQLRAIDGTRAELRRGKTRIVLCLATGAGKTRTASAIVAGALSKGKRVLWIAALRELLDQAADAMVESGIPRDSIGILRGNDPRRNDHAPIQIASIQTLALRGHRPADIVIIDECHLSMAATYTRAIWEPGEGNHYPVVIGLTATPCRGDGQGLSLRYECIVEATSYANLIDAGFISSPVVFAPAVAPDMRKAKSRGGDYTDDAAAEAMNAIAGNIVPTWLGKAEGRPTIAFACNIEHSKDLVRRFVEAGVKAEHLDGKTPDAERADIVSRLRSGDLTLVSNVGVLTAGFDAPNVRCIILARPTKSIVLHRQTSGRCLRPGPVQPIIFDFADNCSRHGLPTDDIAWTLDGKGKAKDPSKFKTCKGCYAYIPISSRVCPYCSFAVEVQERDMPEEDASVEMKKVSEADLRQRFFEAEANKAQRMGFNPRFPGARFREKYGAWPPWSWTKQVDEVYANDERWQEKFNARKRAKEAVPGGAAEDAT